MRLFLVRHGHRTDDPNNPFGQYVSPARPWDPDISMIGVQQAKETGVRFKKSSLKAIYASPFLRTAHTAHLIASELGMTVTLDWGLGEHIQGINEWPGTICPQELHRRFPTIDLGGASSGVLPRYPEDEWQMHHRCLAAVRVLVERHSGQEILCVTHAGPQQSIPPGLVGWEGYQPRFFLCGVTSLCDDGGRWVLEQMSDTSHLTCVRI